MANQISTVDLWPLTLHLGIFQDTPTNLLMPNNEEKRELIQKVTRCLQFTDGTPEQIKACDGAFGEILRRLEGKYSYVNFRNKESLQHLVEAGLKKAVEKKFNGK